VRIMSFQRGNRGIIPGAKDVWEGLAGEREFQEVIVEGLLEFFRERGLATEGSSLWEVRVWTGVAGAPGSVCIGVRVTDEGWRVCPFAGLQDVVVPFEEPLEAILEVVGRVRAWRENIDRVMRLCPGLRSPNFVS
jgi:hypothetical protein